MLSLGERVTAAMGFGGFASDQKLADEVTRLLGKTVSQQHINNIRNDKLETGLSAYLAAIAIACKVNVLWLHTGDGDMEDPFQSHFSDLTPGDQDEVIEIMRLKKSRYTRKSESLPPET